MAAFNNGHARSGDWMCGCGQKYRVLATDGDVRMWPKNSPEGYRVDPVGAKCVCGAPISRGTVLSALFGANVPGPPGEMSRENRRVGFRSERFLRVSNG